MPDDLSCCPDPDVVAAGGVTYQRGSGYVNATGGSDGVGTCIPKSDAPPPGDTLPPPPMSFVDDEGVQHTWTQAKPTIIVSAFDAIALMHMGMDSSQILGTYGTRGTSGSNANGYYHDGNLVDHGDHANSPYDPSVWPQNPDANELAMLAQAHDLSDCSNTNFWCSTLNHTILDVNGWPDLIIESPFIGAATTRRCRLRPRRGASPSSG
jgi:hypothetical protein